MRIGIIGAGHIGGTAAKLLVRAGHHVAVSNSREPASLTSFAASLGPNAKATSPADAVKFGDAVLLAIPWRNMDQLPPAGLFSGKIVIDAMNPYSAVGRIMDLGASTSSEEVEKRLPGARIVKAFNTMGWKTLETGSRPPSEDRLVLFVAGDDAAAKATVTKLIDDIGFASIDTGSLRDGGRRQQPGSPIYGRPLSAREAQAILTRLRLRASGSASAARLVLRDAAEHFRELLLALGQDPVTDIVPGSLAPLGYLHGLDAAGSLKDAGFSGVG